MDIVKEIKTNKYGFSTNISVNTVSDGHLSGMYGQERRTGLQPALSLCF